MKRRSNTTTAILVVALLGGVAFVSNAFNPPPAPPEKPAEPEAAKQGGELEKKRMPGMTEDPNKKTADAKTDDGKPKPPPVEIQKKMAEQMNAAMKMQREMQANMPKPKDDPSAMNISSDYYGGQKDGTEGTKELDARMEKQKAVIAENRKKNG